MRRTSQPPRNAGRVALLAAALIIPLATQPVLGASASATPDSVVGVWRNVNDRQQLMMVNTTADGGVEFLCQGRFFATTMRRENGFVGIARQPDHLNVESSLYKYSIMHVARVDPTMLHISFSRMVDQPGADAQLWEFVNRYGRDDGPRAGVADSTLPKLGERVEVEELPVAIERVPPDYPTWAKEKGIQGTVMVQALVGKDGLVKDVHVVASVSGLDDYAVGAVRQWRFKPAMTKGKPVAVWVALPVKFTLH